MTVKTCKWQQYIHGQSLSYTKRGKLWENHTISSSIQVIGLAALSHNFYESNKTEIDAKSKRVRRLTGGIGVVEERDMLILPEWSFQFGGRNVVLKNIAVGLENNRLVPYAGNIGMALINQFDKVTINFDKCFVNF